MENTKKAPLVSKELLLPFIVITSLFALWGFANDVTNPMVTAFKKVMPELSWFQAYLVQFAFYFGYGCMAIPAALFIRWKSYKSGIILGLVLYAFGAFMFYPASSLESYEFFLLSLYIITCGLALLETTSNPLILSLGAKETATQRLNLAQSFNPIGSIAGMMVAQFVVLGQIKSADYNDETYAALDATAKAAIKTEDLGIISYPYLGIGIVVLVILVIIIATKIPTVQENITLTFKESLRKIFARKAFFPGVIAQMFYVGAQIMCWTAIYQYVQYINETGSAGRELNATYMNMIAMGIFLAGRFLGTILLSKIKAPRLLSLFAALAIACCIGAIIMPGMPGLISLICISLFMSIMFPTIYGIALKDMGDEAKLGSAFLVMAIVGGAIFPPIQGLIIDIGGDKLADTTILGVPEVKFSFIMPMICVAVVGLYGLYVSKLNKSSNQ
ncbi:L-fucose:H+ symporter permease [Aquimarina sp. AD10]|uniref:MFS transporter n=1 Tax=Aquimarina aggregata TaxID=1642818 RepID=A0A162X384_9FLAO|nr:MULTISPECIES: L-fucose:H+ symporter permease [Aquimarina]AXT60546.1 L-fucose:H+ symporter permease [Aquimarina sp. AD10]KZS38394.1 MFS transporter [Aquimarina aggregata]RKN01637.1 L-fucose:H+ symporter permease [Aquimarina sp. AD10]